MEGSVWPELLDYLQCTHGIHGSDDVLDFLGTDFRWVSVVNTGPAQPPGRTWPSQDEHKAHTKYVGKGPLAGAETIADVESYQWPDPRWWQPADFEAARTRWPDRPILPDLIDIGVNALLVFQTTAAGMEPQSIAAEFGGRLAFYGGIDVQRLLSCGTVAEVKAQVRANIRAFADCGGYVVANSHHGVATIKPENIIAMCEAARE